MFDHCIAGRIGRGEDDSGDMREKINSDEIAEPFWHPGFFSGYTRPVIWLPIISVPLPPAFLIAATASR